jgi:dTDP-4-amino-4,6-dideoxygalactose transaminase
VVAVNTALADRLYTELHGTGIGVSRSYTRSLPDLYAGVLPARSDEFPGAAKLASDLLTLPIHLGVEVADLARTIEICWGVQDACSTT